MQNIFASIRLALPILFIAVASAHAERPKMTAMRVPDNAITVDGRDDDWKTFGEAALGRCRATSGEKQWSEMYPERGMWAGLDDCSITAWVAVDSENLFVLADVRDEFLTNTATVAMPFMGDDFELFVEAGPIEKRFVAPSENYRQIIFVPGRVNAQWPTPFLWQAEKNPGVVAATRMRPWGYTIEVKMPKALWPNWKANPKLDSIGFDLMTCEADAPGVDIHHPSLKGSMVLLSKGQHFQSTAELGEVTFDQDTALAATDSAKAVATNVDTAIAFIRKAATDEQSAGAAAQAVLDVAEGLHAAEVAAEAIDSPQPVVRNAGLIVLAQHGELEAPVDRIIPLLTPAPAPPRAGAPAASTATVLLDRAEHIRRAIPRYAMMALALRHKMPAADLFDAYGKPADDPAMRLTYIWCVGINGDRSVVPKLIPLLSDPNLRVRMLTAMALGFLGDPSAVEPLRTLSQTDPWNSAKSQAKQAIEQIEKANAHE